MTMNSINNNSQLYYKNMAYVNVQMLTPLHAEIRQQKLPIIHIHIGSQKLDYLGKTTISHWKLKIDQCIMN